MMICIKDLTKTTAFSVLLFGNLIITKSISAQKHLQEIQTLQLKISFGCTSTDRTTKTVKLLSASPGLTIAKLGGRELEKNDRVAARSILNCGAGDIDELTAVVNWPTPSASPRMLAQHKDTYSVNGNGIWGYLLEKGSPGQVSRLKEDSWKQPDAPKLTIQLNEEGTQGFSISLEQLVKHRAMWLPEQDVFITRADKPIDFKTHLSSLKGQRILNVVNKSPDASLEQFKKVWTDFGNPLQWNEPWQTTYMGTTGHLTVTAAAHGSIYKFAVDRFGKVRPDFASPYKFSIYPVWEKSVWKRQKITNGLPIVVTNLERNGQFCEMQQFASPLAHMSTSNTGDIKSVMFTEVKLSGKPGPVNFRFSFNTVAKSGELEVKKINDSWVVTDKQTGDVLLMLETSHGLSVITDKNEAFEKGQQILLTLSGDLAAGETKKCVVKLPSPSVASTELATLGALNNVDAKKSTMSYWEDWISKGARFEVPESAVNQLFRANLWHSLILPRHTIDSLGEFHMDLPYANTAYGQKNADWPINQAVYVDYMIYGLRGYDSVAEDEIAAMFKSQQESDGRISGFANWGVYSPAHLYTIAQNYLLSRNGEQFKRLLPNSLKTVDWCLSQISKANAGSIKTGLILAPLNDLTHDEREWAFTQAYFVAGLEIFGKALSVYHHPRAEEIITIAAKMKKDVVKGFARASVQSAVVQLADGSWINYVPTDAMTPRRLLDQWYPSDVDCGPLHLSRLGVFDPYSWLTSSMLNDHEDNLFFKNQGAANEPVYVQAGNTYLLRDDPKAAIRSFYSLMACGFSHEQLTSLEHRWAWGQYYGPPSTDGAWFELYRKMLLNELGYDTLLIGQAIPRKWLENGKQIDVKNAPTYFGPVSFTIKSETSQNKITAAISISNRNPPKELLIRFRHPQGRLIRSVVVNHHIWKNFNAKKEYIIIAKPSERNYVVAATY